MKAEIIAVGTEILTGQIVNTNAQFLSEKFAELGIDVYFHIAVGDNTERLLDVIDVASKRSNLVVLCGGLGPTEDDLTKQTLASYLGRELVFDADANERLDEFFATRPQYVRTPNNERQAMLVEGSTPIQNVTGLAVGGLIEQNGVTYVVLPGPPSELKPMVNENLVPLLSTNQSKLYSRVLRFFGIGESQLVTVLQDKIDQQTDPTIAPYAKTGEVTLRISTKATSEAEANQKLDAFEAEILAVKSIEGVALSDLCYGYGDGNSLGQVAVELLKEKGKTLTAAESLTAGLLQARIADFEGSSSVFKGGFVAYSLEEKAKMLGIPQADLEAHGTVSAFTAEQMATKARELTGSDFALGITGVAGPDTLESQPVGTVFLALAGPNGVENKSVVIGGRSRSDVRYITTLHAFDMVRRALL